VVSSFQQEHSVHVGTVTLRDYDPLQPNLDLSATLSGEEEQEYYDYPGAYAKLFCNDPGDVAGEAERYARLRLELEECRRHRAAGQGNCRGVLVGYTFELMDYYRDDANAEYVVTTLSHVARGGGYRSWGGGDVDYQCSFMVVSPDKPFRPELKTLRPVVEGTQTAVVVGPSGEEVWTDSHGRVKCQFHWDREGQNDENSSCWIRVATPWGGKGYGHVSIPRIGNEVVIEFLEGDPDQPLIVGSVYNADQTPPNPLPDSDIQMGMKTRSSKGGGGYNEISMTDTKGDELITIHGQHDMDTVVENDERLTVHHCRTQTVDVDEAITIGNDQTVDVGANRTETVGSNESITIGQDRSEQVAGAESVTIGKTREHKVGLNDSTLVGVSQEVVVGAARSITVGATHSTTIGIDDSKNVGSDMSLAVGKNRATSIGEEDTLTIGKKLVIDVGDEIVIKTGKASITMKKDGTIQIVGKDVTLQGSGKLNAKFSKDIVLKGKKILQN
jgi:type VI secretion system secreted protein VgrG